MILVGQRFGGIFGGKIDKAIAFEEVLVLSSYMYKASQVPFQLITYATGLSHYNELRYMSGVIRNAML